MSGQTTDQAPYRKVRWTWTALPGLAMLLALFVAPLGLLVVYSFGTIDVLGRPVVGFVWTNYEQVLQGYNLPAVLRTLAFAVAATAVSLVLGYAVAYAAVRFAGRAGPVIIALLIMPWLVDYLVRIYAWKGLLAEEGLVNWLLSLAGLGPVQILGTPWAVVGGLVYGYLPLMVVPIYAAFGQMDMSQIDAGKDLFGTPVRTFWYVTLPATREGVVGGCLLVFLPVLGDFATTQFLGGPNTTMIGNVIADQFVSAGSQPFGAAMTVTLLVGLVIAVLVAALATRRRSGPAGGGLL
ncbi:ABC transporter permease [Streptomyces cadmiisoli]|uniref:ABC transporter permease n=1 Tax=Streptomyces cadmiisoli TaxID=2184053 RepID=A0A2Z4JEX7_9ACTN|nr:ABC transporter permease [Streptomyces cadmiisoli]AWW43487.1 ABC transporter permease [Streptomyces cadmiisoli]